MRNLLRSLTLVAAALLAAGCKSKDRDTTPAQTLDQVVYTKVGMHFDSKRGRYLMYSSNYLNMPKFVPAGTQLTLETLSGRGLTLRDGEGSEYFIEYVPKHSLVSVEEWKDEHFSTSPVALPETLTDDERAAIAAGEVRVGMSRDAVFLAVGYPPQSTNPSRADSVLTYEWRRFIRRSVRFDSNDKVEQVGL